VRVCVRVRVCVWVCVSVCVCVRTSVAVGARCSGVGHDLHRTHAPSASCDPVWRYRSGIAAVMLQVSV
jgi:hypothetical protein